MNQQPKTPFSINPNDFDQDESYEVVFPAWLLAHIPATENPADRIEKLVKSRLTADEGSDWLDSSYDAVEMLSECDGEALCVFKLQLLGKREVTVVALQETPQDNLLIYILTSNI